MNYLDLFFTIVLGSGLFWGYKKGFIKAAVGFLAIGISIWAGFQFSKITEYYVEGIDGIPNELINIISLIITIVLVYFLLQFVAKFLHGITHTIGLGIFNRMGGAVLGVLLNILVLGALVNYILPFVANLFESPVIENSIILPFIQDVIDLVKQNFHLLDNLKTEI